MLLRLTPTASWEHHARNMQLLPDFNPHCVLSTTDLSSMASPYTQPRARASCHLHIHTCRLYGHNIYTRQRVSTTGPAGWGLEADRGAAGNIIHCQDPCPH